MDKKPAGGRRYIAPILCGIAVALIALFYVAILLWTVLVEPISWPFLAPMLLIPGGILFGVIYATLERIREIKGGEEDDSGQY